MQRIGWLERQRGFTLIEAAIVIALTGIVAAFVAVFMRHPVQAYLDQARRADLTEAADSTLRRIARDLQRALPNSVRIDATGTYLEFLPLQAGGRYRAERDAVGTGDFLDFTSASDGSFDVLGPPVTLVAGDQLVIYNLGMTGADAYAGNNRRAVASTGTNLTNVSYVVGGAPFPYVSPSHRFHVVSTPVSYVCAPLAGGGGTIRRYAQYAIQASQPTNAAAPPLSTAPSNALLADKVDATCSFSYSAAASRRNGLLSLRLTLSSGGESVTLLHQVHIDNSP